MTVTMHQILTVTAEFDTLGGASAGLLAWELGTATEAVTPAWEQAIHRGLLISAPIDPVFGEAMYRIGPGGRRFLSAGRERDVPARVA
jgi:hypothetical protein